MEPLSISVRVRGLVSKENEPLADCQDACEINEKEGLFAIADGVNLSFFSARWANLLVRHFCRNPAGTRELLFGARRWQEWLEPIRQLWLSEVTDAVTAEKAKLPGKDPRTLSLANSLTLRDPAASTFIGVSIRPGEKADCLDWEAVVVGDSCLMQLHSNNPLIHSVPISRGGDFTNHPDYFSSIGEHPYAPAFHRDSLKNGEALLLATDTLSKWLLRLYEAGEWRCALTKLATMKKLSSLVQDARRDQRIPMENDDVALLFLATPGFDPGNKSGAGMHSSYYTPTP